MLIQQTANQPPKNEDLDFLARKNEELLERSRERRAGYKLIDSEIVKEGPEPVPQAFKDQVRDLLESRNSVDTTTRRDHDGSGYVTDDKPRGIMKRRELETRDQMMYPAGNQVVGHRQYQRSQSNVSTKPSVTETVQRFEETRRTEEVMRRVQRKERRERRSRHHSSSHHHNGREAWENGYHTERRVASVPPKIVYEKLNRAMTDDEINKVVKEAYEEADEARRNYRGRSNSASRGQNGFLPSTESYSRQTTTRRENDHSSNREDEHFGRGLAHARYGSLSDSLRRGELKYVPNGEVRETHWREGGGGRSVHKSNSTRDVFGDAFDRSGSSYRRGSHHGSPVVEFPPTLPRRSDRDFYRPVSKSRSYADWDDAGRAGFGREVRRHDDDMSRLEAEFRDSLLMPLPRAGNMNEREYATEQIPGGFEKYEKENRINSGRRIGRHGQPVDFSDASQEYSYKREQELEHRR